ncbi:hypothetical protein BDZ97DRAFT_681899 [Flammula alnicola]|nr:hypothetical protein BDZ97DRAFT_681899 [Flammula alnicola]
MQNMQNTDTRPLPEGWNQHYESTKQLWYYVQTNGMHPQVSFTHPADMVAANRKVSAYEPNPAMEMPRPASGQTAIQPPSHSSLAPSSQSTFAQRLYASSNNKTAAPVINNNDIKSLSTAPVPDVSQTHSNSMRMSMIAPAPPLPRPQGQIYLPNVPPPSSLSSSQLHRFASLDSYTQKLTGANASRAINSSLSVSMNVEEAASPSFMSASPSQQATAPAPAFAPLPDHGHRRYGRAQTYTEGQSATHSAPFNGPRPTPHLVTVTRPPNELPQVQSWPSINQSSPGYGTEAAPSYAQITPSAGPLSSVSVGGSSMSSVSSNSPPATSILFSPSSVATPSSAPTTIGFPPTSPAMSISSTMSSPTSASFSSAYPSANPRSTNPTPSQGSGRFAAEAAIRLTGSIATAATGIPLRGLARTVGSIVTDQSFINMLKSAFSKSNNGVAESDLQAVIQGQPDANYQAIINALIRQQQLSAQMQLQMGMQYQRPPDANVDYQALIGEIARLQKLNEAAQQQTMHGRRLFPSFRRPQ